MKVNGGTKQEIQAQVAERLHGDPMRSTAIAYFISDGGQHWTKFDEATDDQLGVANYVRLVG